ncbi:MAG TPA: DUF192 domain-containing protein [Dongiaceae bacterium]|nr:DUF192 domain-containing protein [Dongiaceae bacterium]
MQDDALHRHRRPAPRARALVAGLALLAATLAIDPLGAASPDYDSFYRPDDARRAFAGVQHAAVTFPGGRVIAAEIADTREREMYGYMYRPEVPEDEGMVFVYPESGWHSFWMKNTLVPLDILWLDETFRILHMETPAPPCKADPCPSFGPMRASRYVVETRAGTAAREGLKIGDRLGIVFPGAAGEKPR